VTSLADEAAVRGWLVSEVGCDDQALDRLERLVAMLREENTRQNLVSSASLDQVWTRHIGDSAQLLRVSRETGEPWLDLGTGAGFPGLVIAICRPQWRVCMVESRRRRAEWLASVVDGLSLAHTVVEARRLEEVPSFAAGTISARAFAPLPRLVALSTRFSTRETLWLLPKGRNGQKELGEMPKRVREMFHVESSLTDPASVILVGRGRP
jgi:16S rRNA (guanine527-N7)-methyltransferase